MPSTTTAADTTPSSLFRIEQLNETNWVPWKRRVTAIFRERGLLQIVEGTDKKPVAADPKTPTNDEKKKIERWEELEGKAQTQIELTLSDSQMVHIAGAKTAADMWLQLKQVKERGGKLGILSLRRRLYRTIADDATDIAVHITEMRRIREELAILILLLIISSLPESWDNFTSAYLGASSNRTSISSHEFISLVLEEHRRRQEKTGDGNSAMYGHAEQRSNARGERKKIECYNCHKMGHIAADCWSKGGGKEGKGPGRRGKGEKANKANDVGTEFVETAYAAAINAAYLYSWLADSGTTSHICNDRNAFIELRAMKIPVEGVGVTPLHALGRGTVLLDCEVDGKMITHRLLDVLYAPTCAHNLLSISRLDDAGLEARFSQGKVEFMRRTDNRVVAAGCKNGNLYPMIARARKQMQNNAHESAHAAAEASNRTWDAWHRRMGHLSKSGLERLVREKLVEGLTVDENSPPLSQCEACIGAKMITKPYPKEVTNRREDPGELTHSDIWGPARVESLNKSKYAILFTDDATRHGTAGWTS